MSIRTRKDAGYGLGIAAFAVSIVNLILFFGLAYFIFFENKPGSQTPRAEIAVKTIEESTRLSEGRNNAYEEEGKLSNSDKDMIYQAVRGTTLEKNKKIDEGREISKLIWVALREFYNKYGHYPPQERDIFGSGSYHPKLNLSRPPTNPYFIFDILNNGEVQARPNTSVDPSLGDVLDIRINCNGTLSGGDF